MTMSSEATPLAIEDYEAIEAAVMETARGRWFLDEYARRHRQADTLTIVDTLERIERTINRQRKVPDIDRIRLDLADMAEAIIRTKQEIFQMKVESEEGGRFAEVHCDATIAWPLLIRALLENKVAVHSLKTGAA